MSEHEIFERGNALRRGLASYLGVSEVANVGITTGPGDEPVVTMPLVTVERLLRDAVLAANVEQARTDVVDALAESRRAKFDPYHAAEIGGTLHGRIGREVTIACPPLPPVAGAVLRLVQPGLDERPFVVLSTETQGDVEIYLDTIESVSV